MHIAHCFSVEGVLEVTVGYSGGKRPNPTYQRIYDHTECVLVRFDPARTSYAQLVDRFFESHHVRVGAPSASGQYRSVLAWLTDDQRRVAESAAQKIIQRVCAGQPANQQCITTAVEAATEFYRAEEYHLDYFNKQQRASGRGRT